MEHIFIKNIGLNRIIGAILLAFISYIVFLRNINFITKLNSIIVPILILFIIIIGLKNIFNIGIFQIATEIENKNYLFWIIEAIVYASYNLILLIPVLINLKKYLKSLKQITVFSVITGIILGTISILTFLLLVNVDTNFSNLEMPVVYVIKNKFSFISKIYGIVILIAIFTTAISVGISFLNNICKNKKSFQQFALFMCITSVFISQISFSKLVEILFPIFGYLGLIQIYFVTVQ